MEFNIYKKINTVKEAILNARLKKSGKNAYAGFEYYELSDFLPTIIRECINFKLLTQIKFDNETAKLIIINADNTAEQLEYTSPMRDLQLKGCNEIQALGGVQTYQRRYLYMMAFDIVEPDLFDPVAGKDKTPTPTPTKPVVKKIELDIKNYGELEERLNGAKTIEELKSIATNHKVVLTDEQKKELTTIYNIKKEMFK